MARFDQFEFRCSGLDKIWNDGKLTVANITFLIELFVQEVDGVRKDINSKYFEKGKYCEMDGVKLIKDCFYPENFVTKNKERKSNGWISGECDLDAPDGIIWDVKNAWDKITFEKAKFSKEYERQGRGYMWLWGAKKFRLFYTLSNMPEHMICEMERKLSYQFLTTEDSEYISLVNELRAKHNYDNMKQWEKFKLWEIEHDEQFIRDCKRVILTARTFLNKLWVEREERILSNQRLMNLEPSILIASHDIENGCTIIEPTDILSKLKKIKK